jgi:hypothetical protein
VIEIGQPGFNLKPFVTGRERMPPPGGPFFGPELTMLHILAGSLDLSIHEARMFALATVAEAKPDRYRRYVHQASSSASSAAWNRGWSKASG